MKRSRSVAAKVCFDDRAPVIISVSLGMARPKDDDHKNDVPSDILWYSPEDIATFKKEHSQLRKVLFAIDKATRGRPFSWSFALRRLYRACCTATHMTEVMDALQSTTYPFHETTLGMERQGLPDIAQSVMERRSKMYTEIQKQQEQIIHPNARSMQICNASSAISRPSVLYARLLAEIVAATLTESMAVELACDPSEPCPTPVVV